MQCYSTGDCDSTPPPKEWLPDVPTIEVDGPEGWSAGSMLWRSMKKNRAGIQPGWSR